MARISIDTKLFTDKRFIALSVKLQSATMAIGALVEAWIVAQEFWKIAQNGIPKPEWKKRLLNDEIIACGLAEDTGEFIKICGSEEHFSWLLQRINAGRKGGLAGKRSVTGNQKGIPEADAKQALSKAKPSSIPILTNTNLNPCSPDGSLNLGLTGDRRVFDFDIPYRAYPKKIGKKKGIDVCKRQIKTEEDFKALCQSVQKYAKYCAGKDPQYIKHFSTFMGEWRDWLDPETGRTVFTTGGVSSQDERERAENEEIKLRVKGRVNA